MSRILINGDYLIVAPRGEENGYGYYHEISERAYLADNIMNFLKNYPVDVHDITIYELKEINARNFEQ